MKQFIARSQKYGYSIYRINGNEYLYKVATFVVTENYKHHTESVTPSDMKCEIHSTYKEELLFNDCAQIYIAEDDCGNMIGCIRVLRWNEEDKLPIQTLFGINPMEIFSFDKKPVFWHIGRFAISKKIGTIGIILFKQLMLYAINPILYTNDSYMIAECDSKLLRTINKLGIDTTELTSSTYYLGSETIPVYSTQQGLNRFYNRYNYLNEN